jgi:hypothetical protein
MQSTAIVVMGQFVNNKQDHSKTPTTNKKSPLLQYLQLRASIKPTVIRLQIWFSALCGHGKNPVGLM